MPDYILLLLSGQGKITDDLLAQLFFLGITDHHISG
jgi:hypothetical protein